MPFKPVPPDKDPLPAGRTRGKNHTKISKRRQKLGGCGQKIGGFSTKSPKNC